MKLLTAFAISVSFLSFAVQAESSLDTQEYQYGKKLDISHVVSITTQEARPFECGSVNEEMVYIDSKGQQHHLTYKAVSKGCQW